MLYSVKRRRNLISGELVSDARWIAVNQRHLKDDDQMFLSLVSALPEFACKHKCSLPKRKSFLIRWAAVQWRAHTRLAEVFFLMEKWLYCKYILSCTFVWHFFYVIYKSIWWNSSVTQYCGFARSAFMHSSNQVTLRNQVSWVIGERGNVHWRNTWSRWVIGYLLYLV